LQVIRLTSLGPQGWPPAAVAVGNFDGVHRGHQALVEAIVSAARESSGTSVVLTFDPHPARVLFPDREWASLLSFEQRAELLERLGVERLAVLPFDAKTAAKPPEAFASDVLKRALDARLVVVGRHFRFGRGRSGDATVLAELGRRLGFAVRALEPVLSDGEPVSSSRIRDALARGDTRAAARMLGRDYFLDGTVVRGVGRGRTLGVPTANLEPTNDIAPAKGVYASWCHFRDAPETPAAPAVVNIGVRPTFEAEAATTVEAHLIGYQGDLYGRSLRLHFKDRLRGERRFPGAEELLEQIQDDVERARAVLEAV
jgi:riboflavin kinase/FMN adenylyltransferase